MKDLLPPPLWSHPNCKSGSFLALREVNLWHYRETQFASRRATLAAEYARRQQIWWTKEAGRFERDYNEETSAPPPH